MSSHAFDIVGFALLGYGFVRAWVQVLFHGRWPDKRASFGSALGSLLLGVARWLDHSWPSVGINVFFCAVYAVLWWRGGGDDDWRRRRRRLRSWARSHIPRPVVVQVRPLVPVSS